MNRLLSKLPGDTLRFGGSIALLLVVGCTYMWWWPPLSNWIDRALLSQQRATPEVTAASSHAAAHAKSNSNSIVLTKQSRLNLGLTRDYLRPIELSTYRRSITVPAVIVPKPGRSQIVVASPLSGVVTHVHAVTGEAVEPGELLFEIRLTYEDLVETQTLFLRTLSELEVENREIERLEKATQSGAISGKSLLDRRYAKDKLEAHLRSLREALRLHGLSDRQVEAIGVEGKLLRDLRVVAPDIDRHDESEELHLTQVNYRRPSLSSVEVVRNEEHGRPLVIDDLQVHKGQAVLAGERLCVLSDYSQLFIEGKAFEQDVPAIAKAAEQGWRVEAVFAGVDESKAVGELPLAFVDNSIDPDSRTLSFFVELPNRLKRDETNADGQRYLSWEYRVGQRLELRVPVELWEDQIVLPVEAVVKEGAEWYVFQQSGNRFTRVSVHVKFRDQTSVVIANDGSISPGDVVALKSAHQMQMAIKNQAGGGADPHAGHTH